MRERWARGEDFTDEGIGALYDYVVGKKKFIEKIKNSKWPDWSYKYPQFQLAKRFLLKVCSERADRKIKDLNGVRRYLGRL